MVEYAGQAGDVRIAARAAGSIAYLMLHGSTPAREAVATCDELLERVAGDRAAVAAVQSAQAILLAMQGDFEAGRSLYRRGYAVL